MKEVIGQHYYICHCIACPTTFKYDDAELKESKKSLGIDGKYVRHITCPNCRAKNIHTNSKVTTKQILKG